MNNQEKQIERFYSYLDELEQSYGRLADLLRQKLVAVEKFDVARLDEIIKEEQVYVLLSKGFDSNLRSYREKLSLKGETLGEIIDELPTEARERFRVRHGRLKITLDGVKDLNEKCQRLIETRLYTLDKAIKGMDKSEGSTYGKDPKPPADGGPRLFTKSI